MERQGTYEGMVEEREEQQEHPTSLCLVLFELLKKMAYNTLSPLSPLKEE